MQQGDNDSQKQSNQSQRTSILPSQVKPTLFLGNDFFYPLSSNLTSSASRLGSACSSELSSSFSSSINETTSFRFSSASFGSWDSILLFGLYRQTPAERSVDQYDRRKPLLRECPGGTVKWNLETGVRVGSLKRACCPNRTPGFKRA